MHHPVPIIDVQEPSPVERTQIAPFAGDFPNTNPRVLKHRASRVEEWIDQQSHDDKPEGILREAGVSHHRAVNSLPSLQPSLAEQSDYIFVDEETCAITQEKPDTPQTPPHSPRHSSGIFNAPSPLRNFRFSFSPSRRSSSPFEASAHSRGSSLSALPIPSTASPMVTESPRRPQSAWKPFRRPSVLGHFEEEDSLDAGHPRPSTSSNGSYSTRPSIDTPSTIPTLFSYKSSHKSSPSLWSIPSDASHQNDPPNSTKLVSQPSRSTIRVPFSLRSSSGAASSSILSQPRSRKKKYLVISGIGIDDEVRYDAAKEWCESFGELKDITRMPNGDIHVDFRLTEVADTVCRVQARVSIAGVGSVCLSWYSGKRP